MFNRIEKKKMAMKTTEATTTENIKGMTKRLVEIKNLHLIKSALDIAKKVFRSLS